MKHGATCILCVVCLAAAGSWGASGRLPISGVQNTSSLLPQPKLDIAQVFEDADVNHDERVTFEEAHNYNFLVTQEAFNSYDIDLNGYIDRTEAGLPPVDIDIGELFENADVNNDELMTFEEAYACNPLITAVQFYAFDSNLDGFVDRAEAGLPPDTGKDGCEGCNSGKSRPVGGDWFTMALSLLGLAVLARGGRSS